MKSYAYCKWIHQKEFSAILKMEAFVFFCVFFLFFFFLGGGGGGGRGGGADRKLPPLFLKSFKTGGYF